MNDTTFKNSDENNGHEFDCRLELLDKFENSTLGTDCFVKIDYTKFK